MRTIPEVAKTEISCEAGVISISQYRGYTTHQIFIPVEMLPVLQETITQSICDALGEADAVAPEGAAE